MYSLLLYCVGAFLTRILSCQFQSEPGLSQSQLQLTFWCISILMYTVSSSFCQQERVTTALEMFTQSCQELHFFKHHKVNGIGCQPLALYCILSAYIVICIAKEKLKWEPLCFRSEIGKDSLIYTLQSWRSSVLLSFTFLCFVVFRTETVFVVTSCQGWLGLNISCSGQEAVWFFCSSVIRPPLSLACKCDARHLKVLSSMIKGSSLSVASLRLIPAPTEQCVQPKERCNCPCHPEEDLLFS